MLPGIRAEPVPDYLADESVIRAAGELRLTSTSHPLGQERAATASGALLSALQPLGRGQTIRVSWVLAGTTTPHPAGLTKLAPDLARFRRLKQRSPLHPGVRSHRGERRSAADRAGALVPRLQRDARA